MNPENHLVNNLFEVSLVRFHFDSLLKYLDCCYTEYPLKQTASLYLKLPFKPVLSLCLFLVLER